jgi:hypothetical protein
MSGGAPGGALGRSLRRRRRWDLEFGSRLGSLGARGGASMNCWGPVRRPRPPNPPPPGPRFPPKPVTVTSRISERSYRQIGPLLVAMAPGRVRPQVGHFHTRPLFIGAAMLARSVRSPPPPHCCLDLLSSHFVRGLESPLSLVIAENALALYTSFESLDQRLKRLTLTQHNLHRNSLPGVLRTANGARPLL